MVLLVVVVAVVLLAVLACLAVLLRLMARWDGLDRTVERLDRAGREDSAALRREMREEFERIRSAVDEKLQSTLDRRVNDFSARVSERIGQVGEELGQMRLVVDARLTEMRHTVDEKLQTTLDRRLNESFQRVSERLEQVCRGLGEMQALASEVGDVKRALTSVRARGVWGEVQAGALLEELLTPDQFGRNIATAGGSERVEFAVRMPGDGKTPVWLPIDAKFPLEDYLRLVDASERGSLADMETHGKKLEDAVRECARSISRKYLSPPLTTDFAILYLPTESLFAEVLRRSGVVESLQRDFRVTVAGPTTLSAFLNSLRMGFRTLAIQQRSSEVWELLGEVKTEFSRYSDVLAKVQKKLQEATNTVEGGLVRTRVIEKKLRNVQDLPAAIEEPGELFLAAGD